MKYSCSLDFARHHNDLRIGGSGSGGIVHTNHTYSIPPNHPDNPHHLSSRPSRGPPKEKQQNKAKDYKSEEHLSRDEKRARSMGLPMSTDEIINLPMDEFNERLSKFDLTETQLNLIRDIRRRGKNKVAAQNCRKRKLDQITQLAEEVQKIRDRKQNLMREQDSLLGRRNALKDKYSLLYRHVFQALKDPEGGPYSPYEYSLQQAADGSIILVPRNPTQGSSSDSLDSTPSSSRRSKSKDHDMKKGGGP
jgi:nuclear factor erythroid 2